MASCTQEDVITDDLVNEVLTAVNNKTSDLILDEAETMDSKTSDLRVEEAKTIDNKTSDLRIEEAETMDLTPDSEHSQIDSGVLSLEDEGSTRIHVTTDVSDDAVTTTVTTTRVADGDVTVETHEVDGQTVTVVKTPDGDEVILTRTDVGEQESKDEESDNVAMTTDPGEPMLAVCGREVTTDEMPNPQVNGHVLPPQPPKPTRFEETSFEVV